MAKRQNISSGTKFEDIAGYSRAVRLANIVHVSGTTATNERDEVVGMNSAYEQTVFIIQKIERALNEVGAQLGDVVRTRIFLINKDHWPEAARAHAEFFSAIRPANTLLEVSGLIGDEYLVEMEAEAIIGEVR